MQSVASQLNQDKTPAPLTELVLTLLSASTAIAHKVRQGALAGVLGSAAQQNVQGETQKKLDVIANDILKEALLASAHVKSVASEEEDNVVPGNPSGAYVVAFDPLDGSSNIDINGQIGTIFTIYRALPDVAADSHKQFAQQGRAQVCAGYVLYGPSTQLALTTGGPSRLYTLDPHDTYQLTQAELAIAPECQEFSVNMSNLRHWSPALQGYIQSLQAGKDGVRSKDFNMRWNGAMVGDVHRVLMRGGIFLYPANTQGAVHNGKLRLLYEANPMALLVERAGGRASDGKQAILDIEPGTLHQRVPVFMGAAQEVAKLEGLV
ncbi:class 1 fructose-bisphosphatase [Gilvimarinus polysaccharolyticus]|uniref:class 1 fructose-bisphosphatase n=1 Tax=Gilvimarinus polysaccharolyticus TaxID=863921 RepID=UPI000673B24C|nr:class 1 fructose-bisphosphatase [Gilvimarinus polysaccharolyticus]